MRIRAWQIILALLLWTIIAYVSVTPPEPAWLEPLAPIIPMILVANALTPSPWLGKWLSPVHFRPVLTMVILLLSAFMLGSALFASAPETDQALTLTCAARSLWHHQNPYHLYEPQCVQELRYTQPNLTIIAQGPFAHLHSSPSLSQVITVFHQDIRNHDHVGFPPYGYPPDATLLLWPVAFAPWSVIWLYVAGLVALLLLWAWGRYPRPAQWLSLLAAQLLALGIMTQAFNLGWNPEYISYFLLVVAFATISNHKASAICLAAAICTNQLTWPVLPLYLLITIRESRALSRYLWLLGAGLIGTIPWLIWNHQLLRELLSFLALPYFPGDQSLGALHIFGAHSHLYLLTFVSGIVVCGLFAWWRPSWRWAMAAVVWGSFILSSRGLGYYFLPMFWLSPAIILGAWRLEQQVATSSIK